MYCLGYDLSCDQDRVTTYAAGYYGQSALSDRGEPVIRVLHHKGSRHCREGHCQAIAAWRFYAHFGAGCVILGGGIYFVGPDSRFYRDVAGVVYPDRQAEPEKLFSKQAHPVQHPAGSHGDHYPFQRPDRWYRPAASGYETHRLGHGDRLLFVLGDRIALLQIPPYRRGLAMRHRLATRRRH